MKKIRRYRSTKRSGVNVLEHRLIAQTILGRPLKKLEIIHHVDGNERNNANENLVICPDQKYHLLLHTRQRAFDACGNVNFRRCTRCGVWADPATMKRHTQWAFVHRECHNAYQRTPERREANRLALQRYRGTNKDKLTASQRAYREARRNEINARKRQRRAIDAAWRARNLLAQKQWKLRKKAQVSDSA